MGGIWSYYVSSPAMESLVFSIIKSFLIDKSINVVVNSQFSDVRAVNTGIPQRSLLGPTQFLIYINDLQSDL